ncbi:MAG: ABC transporter substrate-binding protein [Defluviimonas sp.]|nr:ABC transporter substrate-binding protein [Defluviimonas sp.]
MYGEPALPPDLVALPYANPDAPKGGRMVIGEPGGFDSLNPWILKGRAPWGMGLHVAETLMARSIDEPFTLYGLLAESVETDAARSFVEFTLRPEARFSDGSPVTVEDVIWSYETLGTQGHPRYRTAWAKVARIGSPAPGKVRIEFTEPDRELALLMGMRPVLKKAQWQGRDFAQSTLEVPIGSGAYTVGAFEPGRHISFVRNPDWWGKDLPIARGLHNLDEIRYEYFADPGMIFEAFKAGDLSIWRETNAARWHTQFDFPAVTSGEVVKAEIPHRRPSGITGLVFNTRRPVFADWRVREALTLAFNFEFINQTLNLGTEPRITSYFANSALAMQPGPATGRVAELLTPFADDLIPGTLEGYAPPVSDGTIRNRANMRRAMQLLEEAGWTAEGGTLRDADGRPFAFEILLAQGAAEPGQVVDIYVQALAQLGITPRIASVDAAQYVERTNRFDFDMAWMVRALSLSPGNEQRLYWGAAGVDQPGSRNWMGMASPAADAMIDHMLAATDPEEMVAAVQALDRVLTAGRWVIPVWYSRATRLAHSSDLHYPARLPLYGDWPGFAPDVWWHEE